MTLKSQAIVETPKATRYLKALCNHFSRKVTTQVVDGVGHVQFGFANCQMFATDCTLTIHITAQTEDNFERVKFVISDHLERFSGDTHLQVSWVDG
ncbi:MAG: DUF2218 domain-containing protein [Chloroflexi bacterium]|nr:MAG: DUF2218 domain-containing protein [Chloroflexota bacterium]